MKIEDIITEMRKGAVAVNYKGDLFFIKDDIIYKQPAGTNAREVVSEISVYGLKLLTLPDIE